MVPNIPAHLEGKWQEVVIRTREYVESRATGSGRAIPSLSLNPRHYDSQPSQAVGSSHLNP